MGWKRRAGGGAEIIFFGRLTSNNDDYVEFNGVDDSPTNGYPQELVGWECGIRTGKYMKMGRER